MEKQTTIEERFCKCPYATAQSLISGKWAVLILFYLEERPIRFNELLRKMPKMTHATLSVQLKALEENGLIKRVQHVYGALFIFLVYPDNATDLENAFSQFF